MTKQNLDARQARWAEYLSQFNFRISYRLGCENQVANALSGRTPSTDFDEVCNITLLSGTLLTCEALADLYAIVATVGDDDGDGGGDEEAGDDEDDDGEGQDLIQELEIANRV